MNPQSRLSKGRIHELRKIHLQLKNKQAQRRAAADRSRPKR